MSQETEIIIQPNGMVLIPRGTKQENDLVRCMVKGIEGISAEAIESFLSITDDGELLFGETTYCG